MALLPPPLSLRLPAAQPPRMHAHLLPLRIEYDGPAPVSRYFLVQPHAEGVGAGEGAADAAAAPAFQSAEAAAAAAPRSSSSSSSPQTYAAAFRGRALHGSALALAPRQLQLHLCAVPSSSSSSSSAPASSCSSAAAVVASAALKRSRLAAAPAPAAAADDEEQGLRRSPRKRAGAPAAPPAKKKGTAAAAKMAVFSMDSDSEGEAGAAAQEEEQALGWDDDALPAVALRTPEASAPMHATASPAQQQQRSSRQMHVEATAPQLLLWAPDGPLDTGDDVYWRTLCEWRGVRQGLMQWP